MYVIFYLFKQKLKEKGENMKRKFLWIIPLVALLIAIFAIGASAEVKSGTINEIDWTLDTETGVLSLTGTGGTGGFSSASPAPWYDDRASIKSIAIGEGITTLGQQVFRNVAATTVSLPSTMKTIGMQTFMGCSYLQSITIPTSVADIGKEVFSGCTRLESVTFAEGTSKLATVKNKAFNKCTSLETITFPDGCATAFTDVVFSGCTNLTSVTFGDKTASVSEGAFTGCTSLSNVVFRNAETVISCTPSLFPENVRISGYSTSTAKTYAETNGFTFVALDSAIGKGDFGDGLKWEISGEGVLTVSGNGAMPDYAKTTFAAWHEHADSITSIVVSEGITEIGKYAFNELKKVTEVTLPATLTLIDENAFRYNHGLLKVNFTKSTTALTIGVNAFNQCKVLPTITIPSNVVKLGDLSFTQCMAMTEIIFEEGVTSIGGKAFNTCKLLNNVTFPASLQTIGVVNSSEEDVSAFTNYCNSLSNLIFLNKDTNIIGTFPATAEDGTALSITITAPAGGSVEKYAKDNGYTFVALGGTTEPEEPETPKNPSGTCGTTLTWELNPETGVLTISGIGEMDDYDKTYSLDPWHAYESNIKSIVIEEGVTTIGKYAFAKISTLESVSFPSTLTTIENYAFRDCTSLDNLSIQGSVGFGDSCFLNCSSLKNLTLGEGITVISARVFQNCDALERVILPASVTRIGYNKSTATNPDGTFKGCDNLKTIIMLNPNTDIYPKNAKGNGNANPHDVTFVAVAGGAVEEYATDEANGYKFVAMQGPFADDCTTVFELTVGEVKAEAGKLLPIVSLERMPLAGDNITINFLAVDENGALYAYVKGEAQALLDAEGNAIAALENTAVSIVYDDENGTARIYVNRQIPTCGGNPTINITVATEDFFAANALSDSLVTADGVVCDNRFATEVAAAEFAGFQVSADTTAIRVLAGINSLYYDKLGVTVELYADGELQGEKTDCVSVVFSSVLNDGKTVTAEELGYSYLAALKVENIDRSNYSDDANVYFVVKPFSVIGDEKFEGVPRRVYIYSEGDGTQAFSNYKRPYTGDDEFVPVLSFVASSDIHVKTGIETGGPERLQKAVEQISEYLATEGVALDALVLAGDITNNGTDAQYALTGQLIANIKNAVNNQNFSVVATMGNHDYGNDNSVTLAQLPGYEASFKNVFGVEPTYSTVINGYYFITITCDEKLDGAGDNGARMKRPYGYDYSEKTLAQAEKLIAEAYAADPEKPIFVVQHVPNSDTVLYSHEDYETAEGKVGKADTSDSGIPTLTELQKKYPNLVVFAGHSHAPANDVASVHQKYFTAINTGVLGGSASQSRADGVKLAESTDPNVSYTAGVNDDVYYVEVDAHNRIRIRVWDATDGKFIGETFMINSFDPEYFVYTEDRYSDDDIFFAEDAAITKKEVTATAVTVEFPSVPKESLAARVYKLVATDNSGNEIVGYVVPAYHLDDRTTPITMTLSGLTAETEYTLEIYALNPVYSNDIADKGTVCSEAISINFTTAK